MSPDTHAVLQLFLQMFDSPVPLSVDKTDSDGIPVYPHTRVGLVFTCHSVVFAELGMVSRNSSCKPAIHMIFSSGLAAARKMGTDNIADIPLLSAE
jgi:hypothetical protein